MHFTTHSFFFWLVQISTDAFSLILKIQSLIDAQNLHYEHTAIFYPLEGLGPIGGAERFTTYKGSNHVIHEYKSSNAVMNITVYS